MESSGNKAISGDCVFHQLLAVCFRAISKFSDTSFVTLQNEEATQGWCEK